MKIETNVHVLKTNGIASDDIKSFSIAGDDSHVFETLIQFYKQPIQSIARELCSNAYDAHVVAGCSDKPFYVQIPTVLNNNFMIKDEGVGIAPEKFEEIYCQFFKSSKRQDNLTIGGFGLGSKTPFAYTSNYTVVNRYNGIKYVYAFFRNEEGVPQDVMLEAIATDEPNGLSIEFCVQEKDFNAFKDAVYQACKHMEVPPKSNYNFDWSDAPSKQEILFEGADWYVLKANLSYYQKTFVVLGNVEYPIPSDDLNKAMDDHNIDACDQKKVNLVLDLGVYAKFAIGELRPIPSRESLMWTSKNTQNVVSKFVEIYEAITQQLIAEIQTGKTDFENAYLSYVWFNKSGHKPSEVRAMYRHACSGKDVFDQKMYHIPFDLTHYGIWDVDGKIHSRAKDCLTKKMQKSKGYSNHGMLLNLSYLHSDRKIKFAVTSGKMGYKAALKHDGFDYHYVCLVDKNQTVAAITVIQKTLEELGADSYIEIINFDDEMKNIIRQSYSSYSGSTFKVSSEMFSAKTISLSKFLIKGSGSKLDSYHLDVESHDVNDVHYYIKHSRNQMHSGVFRYLNKEALLALELDDFSDETEFDAIPLLWLNDTEYAKLKDKNVQLIDFSKVLYEKLETMKSVCEDIKKDPVLNRNHLGIFEYLESFVKTLADDSLMKQAYQRYADSRMAQRNAAKVLESGTCKHALVKWYEHNFGFVEKTVNSVDYTKEEAEMFKTHYPLFWKTHASPGSTHRYSMASSPDYVYLKLYIEQCDLEVRKKLVGML